jgi:hypothetical protein
LCLLYHICVGFTTDIYRSAALTLVQILAVVTVSMSTAHYDKNPPTAGAVGGIDYEKLLFPTFLNGSLSGYT